MLHIPDPGEAVLFGLRITHELMRGHGAPAVRVGLHHGPAVERDGDFFGATVNLAARVSAVAGGGEVLLTGHTAALAPDLEGVLYEPRGRQELRNVSGRWSCSPQCERARTSDSTSPSIRSAGWPWTRPCAGRLMYDGTAYFFCSLTCAGAFAAPAGALPPGSPDAQRADEAARRDPEISGVQIGVTSRCQVPSVGGAGPCTPRPPIRSPPRSSVISRPAPDPRGTGNAWGSSIASAAEGREPGTPACSPAAGGSA